MRPALAGREVNRFCLQPSLEADLAPVLALAWVPPLQESPAPSSNSAPAPEAASPLPMHRGRQHSRQHLRRQDLMSDPGFDADPSSLPLPCRLPLPLLPRRPRPRFFSRLGGWGPTKGQRPQLSGPAGSPGTRPHPPASQARGLGSSTATRVARNVAFAGAVGQALSWDGGTIGERPRLLCWRPPPRAGSQEVGVERGGEGRAPGRAVLSGFRRGLGPQPPALLWGPGLSC